MLAKTPNKPSLFDKTSQISNSTTQSKLLKRRSRSKSLKIPKTQSQQYLENSCPFYFIKKVANGYGKNNEEEFQTADVTPVKIAFKKTEQISTKQKKRLPTPSKSYRQLRENVKTSKKLNEKQLNIERQMQIHQLQKKWSCQTKIRQLYEQKAKQFENQVSVQMKKVKSIEKQIDLYKKREAEYIQKIKQLQGYLQNKNMDLRSTKSSLQKLKENIKQYNGYENQIKHLKQHLQYSQNNQENQQKQLQTIKIQNQHLHKQLQNLKKIIDQHKLKYQNQNKLSQLRKQIENLKRDQRLSRTEKQIFLQDKLSDLQFQNLNLKQNIKEKIIEIDFNNRKKHQEFEIIKKKKSQEVKSVRSKYILLMDQYKSLKSKVIDNKGKSRQTSIEKRDLRQKSSQKRRNRFINAKDSSEEEQLSFSLSPQYK